MTPDNLELIVGFIGILSLFAALVRQWVLTQTKTSLNSRQTEDIKSTLTNIDLKLDSISSDVNNQTLKIQKVETDGIENIRLTQALHKRVDTVEKGMKFHRIKQVRLEEKIKSLTTTQRFKLGLKDEECGFER